MNGRREFLRKSLVLSGAAGFSMAIPDSIQRAMAINPKEGSTFYDAEHVVILMQENRAFDHSFGTLQGVRGFNDPRPVLMPNQNPVWFQTDATGKTYAPFRLDIKGTKITWMGSLPHGRHDQFDAFNQGKYDKWLISKRSGNKAYRTMPLTLGYHTREDLPFYYAMADAFTVCDHNFCSSMTSTTPNRAYFWTGKIQSEEDGRVKMNIRNTDYGSAKQTWLTFPELLQDNGIDWRFYQNELSTGGGWKGEERSWLANFGLNNLEWFKAYQVKFKDKYIEGLQEQLKTLPDEISKLRANLPSNAEAAAKVLTAIAEKEKALKRAEEDAAYYTEANFKQLSDRDRQLYERAFTTNKGDKNYRKLVKLKHHDGETEREIEVPKGDIFYQFRKDVNEGKLPTVSWLGGPKNFSDHPSAPWFGSWYISEVMDILTKNPEVWKKTILIITYDENDGYYDHLVPYSVPDLKKKDTGMVSKGIDTSVEMVRLKNELAQGVSKKQAREGQIGLGYRVPMLIASPWSRGGKVCSEVYDHTSTLQFLEKFINKKFKKNIRINNISEWRRTICGDLTAVFEPFTQAKDQLPFQNRDEFIATIHNAKYKAEPGNFRELSEQEQQLVKQSSKHYEGILPLQEPGIRRAPALNYQLESLCTLSDDKTQLIIKMAASNQAFADRALGAPFTVYSPLAYQLEDGSNEVGKNWFFAVKAGDQLEYRWPLNRFEQGRYHLRMHAPNGFFRCMKGDQNDPLQITLRPELNRLSKQPTGKLQVELSNLSTNSLKVKMSDLSYQRGTQTIELKAGQQTQLLIDLEASHHWYDYDFVVEGFAHFYQQFAGHLDTGRESFTDPLMGRV